MLYLSVLFELEFDNYNVYEVKYNDIKQQLKEIHDLPQPTKDELNSSKYFIIKQPQDKFFAGLVIVNENPPEDYNILGTLNKKELGHDIEILFFFMYNQYRNMGLGNKLFSYVLNKYRNKYIGLGTGTQSSKQAKQIYIRYGFKVVVNYPPFQWWLRPPTHQI